MASNVPAGIQLPFEPDDELLTRMRQTRCWSEFRLYDATNKVLGATIALEWYDKLDESIARIYLRQDTVQVSRQRTSLTYQPPGGKRQSSLNGEGPNVVGTKWTALYRGPGRSQGKAVMQVIEGNPESDEHVSVGTLSLPSIIDRPVSVAHSAGCEPEQSSR